MSTQKQRMYERIRLHGDNLKAIFGIQGDSVALSKKLLRLEKKANRLATDQCNGDVEMAESEKQEKEIMAKVDKILGYKKKGIPVFFNGDCRGYSLKIKDDYTRKLRDDGFQIHTDWGGYGIIAPDLRGD